MASVFRCSVCLQNGIVRDFAAVGLIKSHLGAATVHNMGLFVCLQPGCTLRANRAIATPMASMMLSGQAEDLVLRANIATQVQACLLPAPAPAPAIFAPAAPSQQQEVNSSDDDDDDDDEDDPAPGAGSFDEQLFGEGPGGDPELAIKAELAACGEDQLRSQFVDLEASLQVLRQACLLSELLALVKTLAKLVKSQKCVNILVVL
ncbi:unnamed protein product [Aureobasidium vineae]|uniref:Uncharacterized protein n=1 Tax=Aureobasidium vineae TaxID=2773715 RepID=A0A9N8PA99_9PEZI|nr:unnamed protein product [Aureobasidium vineae]